MLESRIVVSLLLSEGSLVKTVRFKSPSYLGDPMNALRIFNEFEVDELVLLDIEASRRGRAIRFDLLQDIAEQCFMPLTYGGGVRTIEDIRRLFRLGVEKVSLNSSALANPRLIRDASEAFGSQSIMVCIDAKKDWLGRPRVFSLGRSTGKSPLDWSLQVQDLGAGEILLSSIDRDGTWLGYDFALVKQLSDHLKIPLVALGGASCLEDLGKVISEAGASAAAASSLFVYQQKGKGVLLSYPDRPTLRKYLLK